MGPAAFFWVGFGGALGSMARFGLSLLATRQWGEAFPWGTLFINVSGSFVITFFSVLSIGDGVLNVTPNMRLFVAVGLCGGFTTFSSFSLQTLALAQQGEVGRAGLYTAASFVFCLLAAWSGFAAGQAINLWSHR
jgi:CrcB protein